jgi:hypothetical protein
VVPDARHLPRDFYIRLAGFDLELIAFDFFQHNDSDRSPLFGHCFSFFLERPIATGSS